ncbi:MAG: hypothetical protein ACOY3D_08045 [Candidatus Omnitrophota bacterium]
MDKRTLGVFTQLIGLFVLLFLPIPWRALVGIAIIIMGGYIFRQGIKEGQNMEAQKSPAEKAVSTTVIIICAVIIGMILLIAVPNFIKGFKEGRQQRIQRITETR